MGDDGNDRVGQLARCGLFRDVNTGFLARLVEEVDWIRLPAGATLFEEGDEADSLYVVVRGRMRVTSGERAIAELGRDEPLGELGLLAGQPRSATARAIRDTELAQLSQPTFERLLRELPEALAWLTRLVAERVAPTRPLHRHVPVARSIVVLGADSTTRRDELVDRLADALGRHGPVVTMRERPSELAETVDHCEASGTTIILVPDETWVEAALGQADRVLMVADASARPRLSGNLALVAQIDPQGTGVGEELVLVQPRSRALPFGTDAWLRLRPFAAHHHVRDDLSPADMGRLARHLMGVSVGLVLGGGGAKAFAEIGAYRALYEAGVPIDRVGGTSIGAVMAAQVAAAWDPHKMATVDTREFQKLKLDKRVTLPTVSLLSARAAAAMFERMFGDAQLEDLWLPAFVTTVDLTRGTLSIRDRGRVATWIRASASPPALWPPVADVDGSLHVDGAVLDNLPVATMRSRGADRVIAVDVSTAPEFRVGPDAPLVASALTPLRPANRAERYPNLLKILNRAAVVTSLGARDFARASSDLVIVPALEGFGLAEYSSAAQMIEAGYDATRKELEEHSAEVATWI